MAIDRKAMAEQLYGPAGDPTCNIVVTAPFVAPDQVYVRNKCDPDVEGAKKLLDEAGWKVGADGSTREKDGKPLVVTYQTTINTLRQKEQALVKANWSAIGVTVQLRAIDAGVFFSSDKGNPDTAAHFYTDVEMFTNGAEQPDQTNYLCGWATDQIAQKSNGWNGNNYERYSNPDFDKLCQQLRVEPDPAKRNDITLKMNDILVQDVVIIPLIARKNVSGYSKQLKGINVTGWDSEMWNIADWTMGS
jgi:peptide/nickel transport system substrate-binding protein